MLVLSDPDNEDLEIVQMWQVEGNTVAEGEYYTVNADDCAVGSVLECVAQVSENDNEPTEVMASVAIQEQPSGGRRFKHLSHPFYNDDILSCTASVEDANEALIGDIEWVLSGAVLGIEETFDLSETEGM